MIGKRLPDVREPDAPRILMDPGTYRRVLVGMNDWVWECCTPNGMRGDLANHDCTENPDGTLTVEPSILCTWPHPTKPQRYHGYLRNGVWETLADTDPMPEAA